MKTSFLSAVSSVSLVAALTACTPVNLSAQEQRNNFDSCTISFVQQVDQSKYMLDKPYYDKQANEGCLPLLTGSRLFTENFSVPKPTDKPVVSKTESKSTGSFASVCALVKKAAYAHREFRNDDESEDFYDRWYGRIRGYFTSAAGAMRSMSGNYNSLIADAENAAVSARGVNSGSLLASEKRLYAACKLSEDAVWADFENWMG